MMSACIMHKQSCIKKPLMLVHFCLLQDGIEDMEVMYVGCLPVELDPDEQDVRHSPLFSSIPDLGYACSQSSRLFTV